MSREPIFEQAATGECKPTRLHMWLHERRKRLAELIHWLLADHDDGRHL